MHVFVTRGGCVESNTGDLLLLLRAFLSETQPTMNPRHSLYRCKALFISVPHEITLEENSKFVLQI